MKKRISSIIICFVLVFTLLPGLALADEAVLPVQEETGMEPGEALAEETALEELLLDEFETQDDLQEVEPAEVPEVSVDAFEAEYSEAAVAESSIDATLSPAAAAAYAKKLKAVKSDISTLSSIFSGTNVFLGKVLLADVTGDGAPELIYTTIKNASGTIYTGMYQTPFAYNRKTTIHVATYNKSTDSVKDIRTYPGLYLSASNQYATTLEYRTNVYFVDGLARLYEMKYGNISGAAGSYYEYTYNAAKYSFSNTDEYKYDSWGNENEIKNSNLKRVFLYGSKGKTDSGVHRLFWLYECTTEVTGKTYDQAMNYFDSLSVTSVTLNKTSAEITVNSSVTLSATVKAGSAVSKGVTWSSSNEKVATVNSNGKVTAKAYGTAAITAASKADPSVKAKCKIQTRFIDATKDNVSAGMFKAIYWVADQKITGEKVRFGTKNSMTRGQFVRFLYRYAGEPKVSSATNPFSDIDKNYTHYDAILWAVKKGLIKGYKKGTKQVFKPNDPLTRNHVATILWKYAGSPKVSNNKKPFTDVASSTPIAWGKNKGIFTGTTFRPKENCLRGDFAVFLYRFDRNK